MGFFSGAKQWSTNSSYSGLQAADNANFAQVANRTPGYYNFQMDSLKDRVSNSGNILGLDSFGLAPGQYESVNQIGKNAFSNLSSNWALRGLTHAQNNPGLIGATMTAIGPTVMNTVAGNVLNNQGLQANRFDQLNQAMGLVPGLLGNESHQASGSSGPGLGYTLAGYAASAAGYGAGKATMSGAAA